MMGVEKNIAANAQIGFEDRLCYLNTVDAYSWISATPRYKRLHCEYCGCISEKEHGTCEHCGAPLKEMDE